MKRRKPLKKWLIQMAFFVPLALLMARIYHRFLIRLVITMVREMLYFDRLAQEAHLTRDFMPLCESEAEDA